MQSTLKCDTFTKLPTITIPAMCVRVQRVCVFVNRQSRNRLSVASTATDPTANINFTLTAHNIKCDEKLRRHN